MRGTDSGPGDFPPTYKRFNSTGLTWLRFEENRIAEEWSCTDQLDLLLQLGFSIDPPVFK
ncbi:MAG: ester cyclase [Bacteroidetes bacterium]|nr:ester cyclase [Bacteroidota bacterium]